jgi:hypothetical protein
MAFNPAIYTVAIYDCDEGKGPVPKLKGSGVLLVVEDQPVVLTAAHIFSDGGFRNIGLSAIKTDVDIKWTRPPVFYAVERPDKSFAEGLDLALIFLDVVLVAHVIGRGCSFFDLKFNQPPDPVDVVIMCGYPAKKNRYNRFTKAFYKESGPRLIQTHALAPEAVLRIGGDPKYHFSVAQDKRQDFQHGETKEKIPELFDLHGMSGGGVWSMPRTNDKNIHDKAESLVGILVEDRDTKNDRQNMAKVIKIDGWRECFTS